MRTLNWSPFAANPLDYVGRLDLVDSKGNRVVIKHTMSGDFRVTVGDKTETTGSNLNTCYFLNTREVGVSEAEVEETNGTKP